MFSAQHSEEEEPRINVLSTTFRRGGAWDQCYLHYFLKKMSLGLICSALRSEEEGPGINVLSPTFWRGEAVDSISPHYVLNWTNLGLMLSALRVTRWTQELLLSALQLKEEEYGINVFCTTF